MEVRRLDDPVEFLDAVLPLVLADEARHSLLVGIAGTLRDHPSYYPDFGLWLAEEGPTVVGAALRTPPHNLVLARPRSEPALAALASGIADDLPGVVGALPEVGAFASAWSAKAGHRMRKVRGQGIFQLDRVVPVTDVPGRMRDAEPSDRALLLEWWKAFVAEALGEDAVRDPAEQAIDHRLTAAAAGLVLWDDDGPVSFAAFGNPTPNGIRIGPVYTPPVYRRRGYASALSAALSERLLEDRGFCFLFTDLANPTSNKIYEQIGYRRVCEAAEIAFDRV
jgi:predicted GNAT family acetyltransferase